MERVNIFNDFLHVVPLLICIGFFVRAAKSLFLLYSKKKNPDYPLTAKDYSKYLTNNPKTLLKFYITPFAMWKIIFEKHSDKDINAAAKKVRYLFYLLLVLTCIWLLL